MGMRTWWDRAVLVMEWQAADVVGWWRVSYRIANTLLISDWKKLFFPSGPQHSCRMDVSSSHHHGDNITYHNIPQSTCLRSRCSCHFILFPDVPMWSRDNLINTVGGQQDVASIRSRLAFFFVFAFVLDLFIFFDDYEHLTCVYVCELCVYVCELCVCVFHAHRHQKQTP